jgi:hypothetical protein
MPLSTIFDDKLRPQILSVGTTANYPLRETEVIEQKPNAGLVCIHE